MGIEDYLQRVGVTQPGTSLSQGFGDLGSLSGVGGLGGASPLNYLDSQRADILQYVPGAPPRNAILGMLGGAARGLAGALEPLQLPKDVMDAFVAAALDPDTTWQDRMGRLRFSTYVPWGAAPPRAATGKEIAGMLGVQNSVAQGVFGLVYDVAADPLIVGSFLGGASRIARLGGNLDAAKDLAMIGKKVDRVLSPAGVYDFLPEVARASIEEKVFTGLRWLFNQPAAIRPDTATRTLGDLTLSRRAALQLQLGKEGTEIADARLLATQKARAVEAEIITKISEASKTLYGEDTRTYIQKLLGAFSKPMREAQRLKQSPLSTVTSDTVVRAAYRLSDDNGTLFMKQIKDFTNPAAVDPKLAEFSPLAAVQRVRDPERVGKATKDINDAVSQVRKAAVSAGDDPDLAEKIFKEFTGKVVEADALAGLHISGYEPVKQIFFKAMSDRGIEYGDALRHWTKAMERGMRGAWETPRPMTPLELASRTEREIKEGVTSFRAGLDEVLDASDPDNIITLRDAIKDVSVFDQLNLGEFFVGLRDGHMRRSFGAFQDRGTFETWVKSIERGRNLPSNIIDEASVATNLAAKGFERESKLITSYSEALSAHKGKQALIMNKGKLFDHIVEGLTKEGVGGREAAIRARDALKAMIDDVNPKLEKFADKARVKLANYAGDPRSIGGPVFGVSHVKARSEVPLDALEFLGEAANPIVSLLEAARNARVNVGWSDFNRSVFDLGKKHGWVVDGVGDAPFVNAAGTKYSRIRDLNAKAMAARTVEVQARRAEAATKLAAKNVERAKKGLKPLPATVDPNPMLEDVATGLNDNIWKAFAGKDVHPFLRKEIEIAMRERGNRSGALQRIRALVTGGYLASPNVIAANLAGGVYTAAAAGTNPADMITAMAQTLTHYMRHKTFEEFDELNNRIGIEGTSIVVSDIIEEGLEPIRKLAGGIENTGVEGAFNTVTKFVEGQLRAPAGQAWAGLDGFQFAENWLKVSAFRARKGMLAREAGIKVSDVTEEMLTLAAEHARISVFDYSELPHGLAVLRDYGIALFPGFPYFLGARTVSAAVQHPGALAVSDRLGDAIATARMDEEDRLAVYAAMPDWLRDDTGVPIRTRTDAEGDTRYSVIPMNQLIPTRTFWGSTWAESAASGGIWKPFIEILSAVSSGSGEAPFSKRFGQRVFEQGLAPAQQLGQTLGFLANSLAPGVVRKFAGYTPGEGLTGIVPTSLDLMREVPGPLGETIYTLQEVEKRKASRDLWDQAISLSIRSPQVVTTSGPLANIKKEYVGAKRALDRVEDTWKKRFERAQLKGDKQAADNAREHIMRLREDFRNEWRERIIAARKAL